MDRNRRRRPGTLLLALCVAAASACHSIELGAPAVDVVRLPLRAQYSIDEASATLEYVERRHQAGLGNRFRVLVGDAFVRYAGAFLGQALAPGTDFTVRIAIEHFAIVDGTAFLHTRFRVEARDGTPMMDERYTVEGPSSADLAGGEPDGFGRTSPVVHEVRRTLHGALVLTFRAFLADLAARSSAWSTGP
jgi:hypothetical protein